MYFISYYKGQNFAYAESKTYTSADNASVRAILHLAHHSEELTAATIVYQGKTQAKRVRSIRLWNHCPGHK